MGTPHRADKCDAEHLEENLTLLNAQMEAREISGGTKCLYSGFYILRIYFIDALIILFRPFYSRESSPYPIMKVTSRQCDSWKCLFLSVNYKQNRSARIMFAIKLTAPNMWCLRYRQTRSPDFTCKVFTFLVQFCLINCCINRVRVYSGLWGLLVFIQPVLIKLEGEDGVLKKRPSLYGTEDTPTYETVNSFYLSVSRDNLSCFNLYSSSKNHPPRSNLSCNDSEISKPPPTRCLQLASYLMHYGVHNTGGPQVSQWIKCVFGWRL